MSPSQTRICARSDASRRAVDLNALIEESLNLAYHGARAYDAAP